MLELPVTPRSDRGTASPGAWFSAPADLRDVRRAAWLGAVAALVATFVLALTYLTRSSGPFGLVNDFVVEAWRPLVALHHGHLATFLSTGPAYLGSLLFRSPFLLGAMALHSTWEITYAAGAIPCVVAPPLLAGWVGGRLLRAGRPLTRGWVYLSPLGLLMLINPVTFYEMVFGHPEDTLGGVLLIAGVVCAARDRWLASALLIGVAVDNKSWALVAVPVLLAVLNRRRGPAMVVLASTVAALNVPMLLSRGATPASLGGTTGHIFTAPQLFFWFGRHSWFALRAHEIVVLSAVLVAGAWWLRRRTDRGEGIGRMREALWLLALVLFLRAALDTWDNIYYQLPFLLCVYLLEYGSAPRLGVGLTLALAAVTVPWSLGSAELRATEYALIAVPVLIGLGLRTLAPARWAAVVALAGRPVGPGRIALRRDV